MPKPIRFRSPTDDVLYVASTNGQAVRIGHDWREVPRALHADAIAVGAITDNMDGATAALQRAKLEPEAAEAPDNPDALIREAIIRLLESDAPDTTTRAGVPNLDKVSSEAGFNVDRAQMLAVWRGMQAETTGA